MWPDIKCHQKSSAFKYISFEPGSNLWGGAKQGCTRESARGKQGVALGSKLQNGGDARGWSIDHLISSVSPPPQRESVMSYEILNEDKMNIGE